MGNVDSGPDVKIIKFVYHVLLVDDQNWSIPRMRDPERGQTTISFPGT